MLIIRLINMFRRFVNTSYHHANNNIAPHIPSSYVPTSPQVFLVMEPFIEAVFIHFCLDRITADEVVAQGKGSLGEAIQPDCIAVYQGIGGGFREATS